MTDHNSYSDINNIIKNFIDPATDQDLLTAGCLQITTLDNGRLSCVMTIDHRFKDQYEQLCRNVKTELCNLPGINDVLIAPTATKPKDQSKQQASKITDKLHFANIKKIIAVASGKGGVGKSTVAVNIAVSLQQMGYRTGLMDADFYGPSVPKMLGLHDKPQTTDNKKFIPIDFHGLKCMSMGLLIDEQTPVIWRGPVVQSSFQKLLTDTLWQELDILVIDLPPGTGDIHLTLIQKIELDGIVIVSTPQDLALLDARRAIQMFQRLGTPIIGIVENMSHFICPHCHQSSAIFDQHGARDESFKLDIAYLGALPLHMDIRRGGDDGQPIALDKNSVIADIIDRISLQIIDKIFAKID